MAAETTREACAVAAEQHRLAALVLAAPAVDTEIERAVFLIRTLDLELALGHAARAAQAKAGAK